MTGGLVFDPLLPWLWIAVLAAAATALAAAGFWLQPRGAWLRALALTAALIGLVQPGWRTAERERARQTAVLVVDDSASTRLPERAVRARLAEAAAREALTGLGYHVAEARVAGDDQTRLFAALDSALAGRVAETVAGAVVVGDGAFHDRPSGETPPFPVHLWLTADPEGADAGVRILDAPPAVRTGAPSTVRLRLTGAKTALPVEVALDGRPLGRFLLPPDEARAVSLPPLEPGEHWVEARVIAPPGDLSDANDAAFARIAAVRETLKVLLVSGRPYPGVRTWRAFLKGDPSVELVHFTLLRGVASVDPTPQEDLALIEFPTRTLFEQRVSEFDLIVFDRFAGADVMRPAYYAEIARHVRGGAGLLVVTGPEGAGGELSRTALGPLLPTIPTGETPEPEPFRPALTELGRRHPATAGLSARAGGWGRFDRLTPAEPRPEAQVVLSGPEQTPLLTLARTGRGRIATLATDQLWLWARGVDGGGPHAELLRRTVWWLMADPELDEERLSARADGRRLIVRRRSLAAETPPAVVTDPSGRERQVALRPVAPGVFEGAVEATRPGLWRAAQDGRAAAVAVGARPSPEQARLLPEPEALAAFASVTPVLDRAPEVRRVERGALSGPGWVGLRDRPLWRITGERRAPLLPPWAWALAAGLAALAAWGVEGGLFSRRRRARPAP